MIPRLSPHIPLAGLLDALRPAPTDAVGLFESAFADVAGTRHAIAFPYGRTALMCLLQAMGLEGRQIICPSYTCVVVPHAIEYSGNESVFVDVSEQSFLMDMDLAEQAVNDRTGALVATSLFGEPVNLDRLARFEERYPGVAIIQDCAHSFFCSHNGKPVHKHGVAAIYGLNFSKLLTSVFGGMITTDDDNLAKAIRALRVRTVSVAGMKKEILRRLYYVVALCALNPVMFGLTWRLSRLGILDRFVRYFDEFKIDMPADYLTGMGSFEAMIGIGQLKLYQDIVSHRRIIAGHYNHSLAGAKHITLPPDPEGATYSHYVVRTDDAARYLALALDAGIELGELVDYFVPDLPAYKRHISFGSGIGRRYVGRVVNLPVHRGVDAEVASRVAMIMQQ